MEGCSDYISATPNVTKVASYHLIPAAKALMKVRLTKKLAETIDGIDVSECVEGDVIELPAPSAELLIAEAWAERVSSDAVATHAPVCQPRRRAN
jgi:hypothetical protein